MRLSVASLGRMIKGNLRVEFARHELTSYSGLELVRQYLRQLDLPRRLRGHRRGLRRRPSSPAHPGVVLRRSAAVGASPLCRGRSAPRPLLRVGEDPDGARPGSGFVLSRTSTPSGLPGPPSIPRPLSTPPHEDSDDPDTPVLRFDNLFARR
jgi:hypothetical protein